MPNSIMAELAVNASQSRAHMVHAVHRLLHRLKGCLRAYPINQEEYLPECEAVWVDAIDNGPEKVLMEAMKATPALWLQTLPEEVCIVRRSALKAGGLNDDMIEYLAGDGVNVILNHAAAAMHEDELQKSRRKR